MSELTEVDAAAIGTAIRILNEAGYQVEQINKGESMSAGVSFRLDVEAPTRRVWFEPQSQGVKDAALEAQEYGMGGQPVENDE